MYTGLCLCVDWLRITFQHHFYLHDRNCTIAVGCKTRASIPLASNQIICFKFHMSCIACIRSAFYYLVISLKWNSIKYMTKNRHSITWILRLIIKSNKLHLSEHFMIISFQYELQTFLNLGDKSEIWVITLYTWFI